jgi:hypothetical protein
MSNFQSIIKALDLRATNDDTLQVSFVGFVTELSALPKKDIVLHHELNTIFAHPAMARVHLRQLVSWVQEFTPIRVVFKDNGAFDKISFARKAEWNLEGLAKANWYDFEAAKTTKAAKGSQEKALKALAKEAARIIHESGDAIGTMDALRKAVNSSGFNAMVVEVLQSEKFAEWKTQRDADIERAKSAGIKAHVVDAETAALAATLAA